MKFDPFAWKEVPDAQKIQVGKGRVRLHLSEPAALYVHSQGYEALAGYGSSFDLEFAEKVTLSTVASRVFVFDPSVRSEKSKGQVFTNIDRMPDESGNVLEVRRAMRELELTRRSILREIRQERHKAKREADAVIEAEAEVARPERAELEAEVRAEALASATALLTE